MPLLISFGSFLPYALVGGLDEGGVSTPAQALHYVFCLLNPCYAVYGGLYYISRVSIIASFTNTTPTVGDYWNPENNVLGTILILIGQFVLALGVIAFVEYRQEKKFAVNSGSKVDPIPASDVESQAADDKSILAERLRKTFDLPPEETGGFLVQKVFAPYFCPNKPTEKVVVDDVTFNVKEGECFGISFFSFLFFSFLFHLELTPHLPFLITGLLGPNGAGKTTTLNMLTGAETPTSGTATIAGFNVLTEREGFFDRLGYCPQVDALFDDLTVREHLTFYAEIKGIPKDKIEDRVNTFIRMMRVQDHAAKTATKLSGGTKRKLSFAISLVGDPSVLILDEPSSGYYFSFFLSFLSCLVFLFSLKRCVCK